MINLVASGLLGGYVLKKLRKEHMAWNVKNTFIVVILHGGRYANSVRITSAMNLLNKAFNGCTLILSEITSLFTFGDWVTTAAY